MRWINRPLVLGWRALCCPDCGASYMNAINNGMLRLKLKVLAAHALKCMIGITLCASNALAREYFNASALEIDNAEQTWVDLDAFSNQGGQLPGSYSVDLYLNDRRIASRDINFVALDGLLQPELTPRQLQEMGVKLQAFPALRELPQETPISNLQAYIPDAGSVFNFHQRRLDISIPQAALTREARGQIDPEQWDQGLPAALLNYSFSGANTRREGRSGSDDNYYLNLRSGLNLGAWRLRNYSTYTQGDSRAQWASLNTYLQRDVHSLKSQLVVGDSFTPGELFNSVQYQGIQLASDDNMYPDSLRGFAPVVRGIARSNAQVTVRQNGYIIYQTYVPAGAFEITDLYPTSSSGDMEVTITEADGSVRSSIQPFSAVPVMVREGRFKYSLVVGEYRSTASKSSTPAFAQGTLIYGLPGDTTVYAGVLASAKYSATSLGVGHGFGEWGSLSMDVSQARTELRQGSRHDGQSVRFQYAKDIAATNTTFTLAGYRYSTSGYYDFQEANEIDPGNFNDWRRLYNRRSRAQLNINQSLGEYGNFYINGYQQDFWRQTGYERSLSAGYNLSRGGVTYGLSYAYTQTPAYNGRKRNDQQLAFNIQLPLGSALRNSWVNYNLNTDAQGKTAHELGLSGATLPDDNLIYSVSQGYASPGQGNSGNAHATYKGSYAETKLGYNYERHSRQLNYGAQGGVVAHPFGITFSQPQGETMALVRAPGAAGVKVQNNTGVNTDWRGYALVPHVSTYRRNRIALSTETLADDIDIEANTQSVIPTRGALVLADFQTRVGSRVLMALTYQGKPVTFGASATLVQESTTFASSGIVGLEGEVYLSGMPEQGEVKVQWGEQADQQCTAAFVLPISIEGSQPFSIIRTLSVSCN